MILRLSALSFVIILQACAPLAAGEPPPSPNKEEEVDPDVLRKVRKLIKATLSEETTEREEAWKTLKDMGNLAVPGLLGVYRTKETTPQMMKSILIALGDSKDPRAGPALMEILKSDVPAVRRDAARALGDTGYKDACKTLEELAANEKEPDDVRLFSAVAGAKMNSEPSLGLLEKLMKAEKPEIRSRAVFALGKYGGIKQAPVIEKGLDDADQSVREDSVEALRLLKEKPAWGGLVKATGDSDYKVRNGAMDALKQLTGQKLEGAAAWQEWWKTEKDKKE
jgi:HEAT repeat protein